MNDIRILLVEDEPNLGSVLQHYLELSGMEAVWVENGEAGWNKVREEHFDLCLLDVMMPEKDGFSLAADIKRLYPNMPLIFLTAKTLKEDVLHGFDLGADDYITKPFDSEVLLRRIRALLKRSGNISQQPKIWQIGQYSFQPKLRQLSIGEEMKTLSSVRQEVANNTVKQLFTS